MEEHLTLIVIAVIFWTIVLWIIADYTGLLWTENPKKE